MSEGKNNDDDLYYRLLHRLESKQRLNFRDLEEKGKNLDDKTLMKEFEQLEQRSDEQFTELGKQLREEIKGLRGPREGVRKSIKGDTGKPGKHETPNF